MPSVFNCLINNMTRVFFRRFFRAYIGGVQITLVVPDHFQHLIQVFAKLCKHKMYIKGEKYEFHMSIVSFLGYMIDQDGISMDPAKVNAVTGWHIPNMMKYFQWFYGSPNFSQRFFWGFSIVATPLMNLLKYRIEDIHMEQICRKGILLPQTYIHHYTYFKPLNPDKPYTMENDAWETGVGVVLSQDFEEKPKLNPVAFLSMKLSSAERNYKIDQVGSKSTKVDALSLIHPSPEPHRKPFCHLTASSVPSHGTSTRNSHKQYPATLQLNIWLNKYVPQSFRGHLITWSHTFPATGHPGEILLAKHGTRYK